MKDINGKELAQPYYDLAVMRREKLKNTIWGKTWHSEFDKNNELDFAFPWRDTPEGYDWWFEVNKNNSPTIPQSSLDELDAWMREKRFEKREAPAHDWKAKYEKLCKRYKALEHNHNRLCQDYDFYKHRTNVTPNHNLIAECAMRAMQGMLSNPSFMDEQDGYYTLKHEHTVASLAFDYAEAMAAEGRKRGHLHNTENEKA